MKPATAHSNALWTLQSVASVKRFWAHSITHIAAARQTPELVTPFPEYKGFKINWKSRFHTVLILAAIELIFFLEDLKPRNS